MTELEFIEKIKEILDCEYEISMDFVLEEIEEWDSLSVVSFLSMADVYCGKKIDLNAINSAKTIKDLFLLLN